MRTKNMYYFQKISYVTEKWKKIDQQTHEKSNPGGNRRGKACSTDISCRGGGGEAPCFWPCGSTGHWPVVPSIIFCLFFVIYCPTPSSGPLVLMFAVATTDRLATRDPLRAAAVVIMVTPTEGNDDGVNLFNTQQLNKNQPR